MRSKLAEQLQSIAAPAHQHAEAVVQADDDRRQPAFLLQQGQGGGIGRDEPFAAQAMSLGRRQQLCRSTAVAGDAAVVLELRQRQMAAVEGQHDSQSYRRGLIGLRLQDRVDATAAPGEPESHQGVPSLPSWVPLRRRRGAGVGGLAPVRRSRDGISRLIGLIRWAVI